MAAVNFEQIPLSMKAIPNWVLWNNIISHEKKRGTKIPIDANTRRAASSTNADTWCSFDEVKRVFDAGGYTGVGFVLTKESGIFCIDIDKCISKDSELNYESRKIIDVFRGKTYIEGSFHRDGVHIFGFGNLDEHEVGGKREDSNGGDGIEIYDSGRFIAITGFRFFKAHTNLSDCQHELDELVSAYPKTKRQAQAQRADLSKREQRANTGDKSISRDLGITCSQIAAIKNPIRSGSHIRGANPFHGSTTGTNFCINEDSNCWYCFRHCTGGGALELYAVSKGIIKCEDAGRGCLDNKWSEVFEALKADGYNLDTISSLNGIVVKREKSKLVLKSLGVL